ncbi:MAG: pyridoxamine 5'-phosphate oxidase family protein [Burkholderiales bacterium]|nr:pyridoxamine 5'-phosphate oxidase family protein [Burkholderiales bacterium]
MAKEYTAAQLDLQRRFETVPLAETLARVSVRSEFNERDVEFIRARDMFFLATVDANGQPTCSYKGGDPGFVRVVDSRTLLFPLYDGNGMFLSAGNVTETSSVGLLFIDFETPRRLRVEGRAALASAATAGERFPEACAVVRVDVHSIFGNCPRYIHTYRRLQASRYVPREGQATPFAQWKRIDEYQAALPPRDAGQAARHGGTLTREEYLEKLSRGDA